MSCILSTSLSHLSGEREENRNNYLSFLKAELLRLFFKWTPTWYVLGATRRWLESNKCSLDNMEWEHLCEIQVDAKVLVFHLQTRDIIWNTQTIFICIKMSLCTNRDTERPAVKQRMVCLRSQSFPSSTAPSLWTGKGFLSMWVLIRSISLT